MANSSAMEQYSSNEVIFKSEDRYGNTVALTPKGEIHLILQEHDEVTLEQIKKTIEETPFIVPDKGPSPERRVYLRFLAQHPDPEKDNVAVSKVAVATTPFEEYDIIKTAYVITDLEGEINPGGNFCYEPGTGSE